MVAVRVIGVILALAAVAALLWIGSELHYQGCVAANTRAHSSGWWGGYSSNSPPPSPPTYRGGCSRWPF